MTGWKDWEIGEVVTESEFQSFVQDQVVQRYADSSARTSTLGTAVATGMVSYLEDISKVQVYNGASWVDVGQEGDITSVTAGTGLTGGGTAGDVTLNVDLAAVGSGIAIAPSQVTGLTASAAALNTIDDGTAGFTALSNGTAGISYQPVSHNYIINGAFDIWQRGTSFTANTGFSADRFQYSLASGTGSVSQQTFTPADLNSIGFGESKFYSRLSITSTINAFTNLNYRVEDVRTLAGQTATLSFWAKGNGTSLNVRVDQEFDGSATVTALAAEAYTVTSSWERKTITFTLPSISGKTIGSNSALRIYFRNSANENYELDIWGVQLEAGSIATPFKRHAPSLQGELAACQRYYVKLDNSSYAPYGYAMALASTLFRVSIPIPTPLRATPSITQSGNVVSNGTSYTATSVTVDTFAGGENNGHVVLLFNGSSFPVNHAGIYASAAAVELSSEL